MASLLHLSYSLPIQRREREEEGDQLPPGGEEDPRQDHWEEGLRHEDAAKGNQLHA